MQSTHGTAIVTQDTGLTPKQQAEREALAHYWALRVLNLQAISNCGVQIAIQALQDAMKEPKQ